MILIWTPSYLSESPSSCTIRIVPLAAAGAAPTAIKASRARDPAAAFSLSEYDRMRFPLCRGLKFTTLGGPKQCQGCSGQIFSARPGYPAPRQSRPKCGPVREFGVIFSCPESSALYRCGRAARPVEWNHETAQDWDRWLRRRTSDRRRRTRRRLYARQFPCKRQGRTLRRRAARAREGPNTHRVRTLVLPQCHALALRTTRYDRRARRQRVAARFGHPQRRCRMASEKRAACTARRLGVHGRLRIGGSGLIDGRVATTHWRFAQDVAERWKRVRMNPDAIFIKDGKYYTSAGVTAGIDLCLALIEEDLGRELSLRVAREMVVYLKRSGGQMQYSQPLRLQTQAHARFDDIAAWIRGHLGDELTVEAMAEHANLSPRHFTRSFRTTFGITPADFVEELRLDEARWLLVNAGDPIEKVAGDVGYSNDDTFRRAFERHFGVAPREYRSRFGGPRGGGAEA